MTRTGRALAAVALALGALVVTATAAAAHAILLATTPADGDVLRSSPTAVSLRFDEDVFRPAFVTVTGAKGRVDSGSVTIKGSVVSVKVRPSAADGAYTVAYRVASDDGHPVEGTFRYTIAASAASGTPSSGTAAAASSPHPSAPASVQPSVAAVARASTTGQASGSHWLAAFVGIAVVLAGAGALVWERLRRSPTAGRDRAP